MAAENFASQIAAYRQRVGALQNRIDRQSNHLLRMNLHERCSEPEVALEELQTALEELQVAEEELRQQNEELILAQGTVAAERRRYQELFEFAPDGYLVTNSDGLIQEANLAAANLLGRSSSTLVGKPLVNFVPLEFRSAFRSRLLDAARASESQTWETQLQPRGSVPFAAEVTVGRAQEQLSLRWLVRDVTLRQRQQQELMALNDELVDRVLFDETLRRIQDQVRLSLDEDQILQTAVQELTLTLRLEACNAGVYDFETATSTIQHQYTLPGIPAPATATIVAMGDFPDGYTQLLRGECFQFCEITADPVRSRQAILACPIVDHQGVLGDLWCFYPREALLTPKQVSLVQQVAAQCAIALRQARLYRAAQTQVREMSTLNQVKDKFLSTVSHELRTPLTNMKMAIYLLQSAKTDEQRSGYMRILQAQCDQEIELITDLLDLQQAEVRSNLLPEVLELADWLPIITAPFHQKFLDRLQPLILEIPEGLPLLLTDAATLRRSLLELLNNAHKFTPEGGEVSLRVDYLAESNQMVFTLRNQGEIAPQELPHVFDKFYRGKQADQEHLGGTGLGLALVKQRVARLQGAIAVTSQDGWTTFTLQLPLRMSFAGKL